MSKVLSLINLFLITTIIYFGVKFMYLTIPDCEAEPFEAASLREHKEAAVDVSPPPLAYYKKIIDRDIFKAKYAITPGKKDFLPGPEGPELEISLLGTVTGSDGCCYAVIKDLKNGSQQLYKTGDLIDPFVLVQIYRNEVHLLDAKGKKTYTYLVSAQE